MTARRTMLHLGASALAALLLTTFTPTPAQAAGEQFNISASEGRPGMTGGFTQDDPCPTFVEGPGAWGVVEFTFTDAAGTVFDVRDSVGANPDGTWQGEARFTVPYRSLPTPYAPAPFASEAAQGMGSFTARCVLFPGATVVQEYAPQPFNVTGASSTFSYTPATVLPSAGVTITSVDPCPSGQVEVTIRDTTYARTTEPLVVPDVNGAWTVTLPASQPQWDGPDVPFSPGAGMVSASCMTEANGRVVFAYADEALTIGGGTTPPPTTPVCRDVAFIAAAGSGQAFDGGSNLSISPELQRAYNGFRQVLPDEKKVRIRVINYPALPVSTLFENLDGVNVNNAKAVFDKNVDKYLQGKNAGVTRLYNVVAEIREDCPNQAIVLAGYSQGALVVHEFLQTYAFTNGPNKHAIKAVILLADPARMANSGVLDFGDAPSDSQGACQFLGGLVKCMKTAQLGDIPDLYRTRTTSVCENLDVVCDTSNLVGTLWPLGAHSAFETGSRVHTEYHITPEVTTAGKRAARQVINRS